MRAKKPKRLPYPKDAGPLSARAASSTSLVLPSIKGKR